MHRYIPYVDYPLNWWIFELFLLLSYSCSLLAFLCSSAWGLVIDPYGVPLHLHLYTVCSYLHSVVAGGWPVVLFSSNCYKVTCTWFAYIVLLNLWLLLVNLFSYCLLFMNPRHVLHHQADRWLSSVGDKPGLQRQLQDSQGAEKQPSLPLSLLSFPSLPLFFLSPQQGLEAETGLVLNCCLAKRSHALLTFLCPPPLPQPPSWDYRCVPVCSVYMVLWFTQGFMHARQALCHPFRS